MWGAQELSRQEAQQDQHGDDHVVFEQRPFPHDILL
jgi:hypothetical protein